MQRKPIRKQIDELLTHNQVSMLDPECLTDDFLSVNAYAALHGVSPHTVLNWIHAGRISYLYRMAGQYHRYLIPRCTRPPFSRS